MALVQHISRDVTRHVPATALETAGVRAYLAQTLSEISRAATSRALTTKHYDLPRAVFDTLTHRDFCYLSKSRVEPYRQHALSHIRSAVEQGSPIPFYLDLGGGYHASIERHEQQLVFTPGLGEVLVLQQAARFAERVRGIYAPGIHFTIVIDNLCALLVNDIPVACTAEYCKQLRGMIRSLALDTWVNLLVESEAFNQDDYAPAPAVTGLVPALTDHEHQNVERFLGRGCDAAEAVRRRAFYAHYGACSERLLASRINGIHLTQRASPSTLCFRAFPGSDSRIQAGQVALQQLGDGRLKPFLLTSRNAPLLECVEIDVSQATETLVSTVILSRVPADAALSYPARNLAPAFLRTEPDLR